MVVPREAFISGVCELYLRDLSSGVGRIIFCQESYRLYALIRRDWIDQFRRDIPVTGSKFGIGLVLVV